MKFKLRSFVRRKPTGGYTHWDIHALARKLDPSAWAMFDALPKADAVPPPYYGSFEPILASFNMAVNGLKNGVKIATKHHLWSDADLHNHLLEMRIEKLKEERK